MGTVPISTIVHITISLQTQAITEAGFGTPLIVGINAAGWSERVRTYESLQDVGADFLTTDDEYLAAKAIFAQSPHPPEIKIGRQASLVAQVQTITFSGNAVTGNTISIDIDGVTITQAFDTDQATTIAALAVKIAAQPGVATAVVDGGNLVITVTAQNAGIPVDIDNALITGGASQATLAIATTTPNHGIQEDLAEIQDEDDAWYGLIFTNRTADDVELAADYIETQKKIFITVSEDTGVLDTTSTTDILAILGGKSYMRTAVLYSADADQFSDAAWMGAVFWIDPGEETWMFKTLAGVTPDTLTATQRNAAKVKHCNIYINVGGENMTRDGWMVNGEYIDIIRAADWIQARIEERVFALLKKNKKIAYTDNGIGLVTNEIRGVLQNAEENEVITKDPKYSITAPLAASVPVNDRAQRKLRNVKFNARMAGAIHDVTIEGTLTV